MDKNTQNRYLDDRSTFRSQNLKPCSVMQLSNGFISIKRTQSILHTPYQSFRRFICLPISLSSSPKPHRLDLAETLQEETLTALEWGAVCRQVTAFAATAMGSAVATLPLGRSPTETRRLLDQTAAAVSLPRPIDFSGIEDVTAIVDAAVSGQLITVSELCALKRTLEAARRVWEQLEESALEAECTERCSPLLEILQNCNFLVELKQKIEFCINCNFSIILDRASEELEIIRSERKRNMEKLDTLLKGVSTQVFQARGIDKPLITKRRSRMCVGVRASHRSLLPDGIVLDLSSSGVTYFIEPKEAVELNNMEVKLSDLEKDEELIILSLLTSELAESEMDIKHLLERILEVDLAIARAAHAHWMNGVCPVLCSEGNRNFESSKADNCFFVDVEGIQHPLLLESSFRSFSDKMNGVLNSERLFGISDFPVPIDIKIGCGTKVVVISGPNTGGKTASMKTLGLASLMLKAGMYVPAKSCPKIPWFDLILADIGDHQSLEQNLSTFSGHISRVCKILEVASTKSLVLIDEIGSGTDPSEGVALSTSILQYLKDRVNLAVITTHYADLTRLKEKDARFENAAMEFSMESLQPTYRILWGSIGDSNALSIAKSVGFDRKIIEHAKSWVENLKPDKQMKRKGLLYESLMHERNRLESQASRAAAIYSEIMDLYHEIHNEAEDLDRREGALKAKDVKQIQREIQAVKSQIENVIHEFENQLKTASTDQFNSVLRKSESAIASIVEAHSSCDGLLAREAKDISYTPKSGERVQIKGFGDKLATIVEVPVDDDTVIAHYGKMKVRVNKNKIRALSNSDGITTNSSVSILKGQCQQNRSVKNALKANEPAQVSYGPLVQTQKNTVDLRGMRVEEASRLLNLAISARDPFSVIFVIHGMGTGVVKECALEILRSHRRVAKFEQESPLNYGCTVAYIR